MGHIIEVDTQVSFVLTCHWGVRTLNTSLCFPRPFLNKCSPFRASGQLAPLASNGVHMSIWIYDRPRICPRRGASYENPLESDVIRQAWLEIYIYSAASGLKVEKINLYFWLPSRSSFSVSFVRGSDVPCLHAHCCHWSLCSYVYYL